MLLPIGLLHEKQIRMGVGEWLVPGDMGVLPSVVRRLPILQRSPVYRISNERLGFDMTVIDYGGKFVR